jgi:phosphatidylethanolamine N-methyltransferase
MEAFFMYLSDICYGTSEYINIYDGKFILAAFMIIICPVTWNLVARLEFYTKIFSNFAGDNKLAADVFAYVLIEMGFVRNIIYTNCLKSQRQLEFSENTELVQLIISYLIIAMGLILDVGSFYRLGIPGIYYADYFGILMTEKVTAFPYNVLNNPLYVGSTLIFFGTALLYKSPSGLLLTLLVWIMYKFASVLENPMTDLIYSPENIIKVKKKESLESNSCK